MAARLSLAAAFVLGLLALWSGTTSGQAAGNKLILLDVAKGQLPGDTGLDDKTKPEIVDSPELGGKALKVKFFPNDSFGNFVGANKNWKRFSHFRFDAFNPGKAVVNLELAVSHNRTTNFNTRVSVPIKLKPGKNSVNIGIDEMSNANGSAPDLANVKKWFILDPASKGPLVLFSDIWLEGGDAPATPVAPGPAAPSGLVGYRVKGKVGGMDVDLTVTPFLVGGPAPGGAQGPQQGGPGKSDPARLARIKAAPKPNIVKPILFDTPEADDICSAMEIFPADNPWNVVIEDWPVHPNSKNIVAACGADKPFRCNPDMGFVLVPPDQKRIDVRIVDYPDESDRGPYPVPDNVPIEGWPSEYQRREKGPKVTLDDVQRDVLKENGDRHALVVDPVRGILYEFYQMKKVGTGWQCAQASIFDLKSNKLRPEEWTSTDAAGLPIFPATIRYDEIKRGMVDHAIRVTFDKTRREYVYPARHFASKHTDVNLPRMGERLRLKKSVDVSKFSPTVQAILKGLQKYGMYVADNGLDWSISMAPDPRIPEIHAELRKLKGSDFEVITPPPGYQAPE